MFEIFYFGHELLYIKKHGKYNNIIKKNSQEMGDFMKLLSLKIN